MQIESDTMNTKQYHGICCMSPTAFSTFYNILEVKTTNQNFLLSTKQKKAVS